MAGLWIRNGWVLQAGVCVNLYVACALHSVRRAHGAGYGLLEHMCSRGEPLETRGLLGMHRVTSWLHVWLESGRRGLNPCRMVPSKEGRGARSANSCHDVTGKGAQAVSCRAGGAHKNKKREKQASPLRVNRIPRQGVKDPLYWAQDTTS